MSYDEGPRAAVITADDRGAVIDIFAWIFVTFSIIFTLFRIGSNVVRRDFKLREDILIIIATLFATAQSAATSITVINGAGRHQSRLTKTQLARFQQSLLASQILYVSTVAFAKLSLLSMLWRLAETKNVLRKVIAGTALAVLAYFIAGVFVLGLQCSIPKTYDYVGGQCVNLFSFWIFDALFVAAAAIIMLVIPIMLVWNVRITLAKKREVIFAFGLQVLVFIFVLIRLIYLHQEYRAQDHTFQIVGYSVWTELSMHCIVIATNVPSLGPFLKACNSRLWATGGTEQTQVTSARRASASTKGFHKLKDSEVNASEPGRVTEGSMFRHDFGFSGRAGEPGEGGSYEGTERRASDLAGSGGITKTTDWIISKQHEDEARRAPQGPATYVGCGVAF